MHRRRDNKKRNIQHETKAELTMSGTVHEQMTMEQFIDHFADEPRINIIRSFMALGFENLTISQAKFFPSILNDKDFIGMEKSGTGKSQCAIVRAIDLIYKTDFKRRLNRYGEAEIACLVVANNADLAVQLAECFKNYQTYNDIRIECCIRGTPESVNVDNIRKNVPDIIVGTPGRLLSLISGPKHKRCISLEQLRMIYVDEADAILSNTHDVDERSTAKSQLEDILLATRYRKNGKLINNRTQYLFVSATWNDYSINHIKDILKFIRTNDDVELESTYVEPDISLIENEVLCKTNIREYMVYLGDEDASFKIRMKTLLDILDRTSAILKCVIFCNRKDDIDELTEILSKEGYSVSKVHAGLSNDMAQGTITELQNNTIRFAVVSDVFSRGIDITGINCVINFNFPRKKREAKGFSDAASTYIHRIGRSARGTTDGFAINFITEEDMPVIETIEKTYGNIFKEFPMDNEDL